jgi:hypothetical protein
VKEANAIFKSGNKIINYGTKNVNWTNPAIDRTEWQIENVRATLQVFNSLTLPKSYIVLQPEAIFLFESKRFNILVLQMKLILGRRRLWKIFR